MNDFNYTKAGSLAGALEEISANGNNACIAGGTNLLDLMKYDIAHVSKLVDLNGLEALRKIEELPDGGLRLGALATNADTAWSPLVETRYPLLSKAILAGASAQIRHMATNGGNLLQRTRCYYFYDPNVPCNKREPGAGCSAMGGYNRIMAILGASAQCIAVYPSDMSVALAALAATVQVTGLSGDRSIAFDDFHRLPGDTPHIDNDLQPGEIITSIDLPEKGFSDNYCYLKLRDRNSYAFALVSVAMGLELEGHIIREGRIALGGVAHKPWRNFEAEDFLKGKPASVENFGRAAAIILQNAQGYGHNTFKIELAKRAIVRCGVMALDPASQRPGAQPSA